MFAFLKSLRENGIQEWVFEEIQTVKGLRFDNADKVKIMNNVVQLSSKMQFYSIEDVLIQPYLMEAFEPELIRKFAEAFRTENLLIQVTSKSVDSLCNLTEPIYGTRYSNEDLPAEILAAFANPDLSFRTSTKSIGLPPKNLLIPKSMKVHAEKANADSLEKYPKKIGENIWFKQDNTFFSPKG